MTQIAVLFKTKKILYLVDFVQNNTEPLNISTNSDVVGINILRYYCVRIIGDSQRKNLRIAI